MRRITNPRSPVLAAFGKLLREAREDARLSQSELMLRLGKVGHARLSHWERGMHDPGIETLLLLAAALGVAPEDLLPDPAPFAPGSQETAAPRPRE